MKDNAREYAQNMADAKWYDDRGRKDWGDEMRRRAKLSMNGTNGRVYGGDPNLVHIKDGERAQMGRDLADDLSVRMRNADRINRLMAGASPEVAEELAGSLPLCPGCYMVALFDAAVAMAEASGQSMSEMARSMAAAFKELEHNPGMIESIGVKLDEGAYSAMEIG